MARCPRGSSRERRHRSRPLPDRGADRQGASLRGLPAVQRQYGIREHHRAAPAGSLSGRPGDGAANPLVHTLERDGHGGAGQPHLDRTRRSHRELRLLGDAFRYRHEPLFPRAERRPRRRPGFFPGAFGPRHVCAGLSRRPDKRGRAQQLPPGGRWQRPVVLSASLADARFLAVPHRVDGPGTDHGYLPGALHALPARPGDHRRRRSQGLGVHGRWRDGRARVARGHLAGGTREAGQSGVRRQLQPAAPGRSGTGQRQDHPGAGSQFPRCRLERHQGNLGQLLGSVAGARQQGAPRQAHGRGGGWRLPGVQGEGWRLHPQALLRQVPGAA